MDSNSDNSPDEAMNERKQRMTSKRKKPFLIQQRKEFKERHHRKRARLIVRNVSYKATEESLRKHFQKFGQIEELNLLKRAGDGKLVGCAFVQFATVNQATKAILKGNGQPYLHRPVFIDWALGKDDYLAKCREQSVEDKKPKLEPKSEEEHEIKEETVEGSEYENDADSRPAVGESEYTDEEKFVDTETESEEKEDKKDTKDLPDIKIQQKTHMSNDVQEGCTVFLKNVSFDADDDDLRKVCRKFGPVYYAIINREKISGHSKGTAFVKFKSKESADLCLQSGMEFNLLDQVLDPHPALSREEIHTQILEKSSKGVKKDARNLYLAREGLIMAGSKAADGVSTSDMTKRHELERIKAQVLKNLNRFVSRNRLSIHNMPLSYDNEKLKQMIISYTGYRPHECRVMRENKITPEHPKGKSKGFGFMSFNTHQEALTALRKLNNNPDIFSDARRPIVAFSIEDRAVHKIKEKRKEKSKISNPTYQLKVQKRREQRKQRKGQSVAKARVGSQSDDKTKLKNHIKKLEQRRAVAKMSPEVNKVDDFGAFVGTASKPGAGVRLRSNKKIKEQSDEHIKRVRTEKRKSKQRKIRKIHLSERKAIVRPKQGRKTERDDLLKLVAKYKLMIDGSSNKAKSLNKTGEAKVKKPKRTKWYKE